MRAESRPPVVGFWSTQTLRERLGAIVTPYDDTSHTREANHRLAMGSEYFITQSALDNYAAKNLPYASSPENPFASLRGNF